MKNTIIYLTALLLVVACKNGTPEKKISEEIGIEKQFETIEKLQWLVGEWTNITEKEQSFENWTQTNDSTLKAHSFTLVEADTVFAERVTLQQKNNEVFFTVVAYNQNDDQPITFKMIPSNEGTFTFENPQHDFPSRISYTNSMQDSIHAWIEGTVNGEDQKVDFYYTRK